MALKNRHAVRRAIWAGLSRTRNSMHKDSSNEFEVVRITVDGEPCVAIRALPGYGGVLVLGLDKAAQFFSWGTVATGKERVLEMIAEIEKQP